MAQLPFLFYEQKPPLSSEKFKEMAFSQMNKEDSELMKYLSFGYDSNTSKSGCKFIDNWRKWEHTLRLNVGKLRSLKLYNEYTGTMPPTTPEGAFHTAEELLSQEGSPLDGELLLDKARWNAIDDLLAGGNYFDRSSVYAYFLKLLLLERRQIFNAEKGFAEYKSLYAEIIENAQSCVQTSTEETK
ncbi:MAG: hypothetical protein LBC80_03710 [Treponema sp.]|nr:hypothetical protein [Treponema sp.]